jgi:hypothetical protein
LWSYTQTQYLIASSGCRVSALYASKQWLPLILLQTCCEDVDTMLRVDISLDRQADPSILSFSEISNALHHSASAYRRHSLDGRHHDYKDLQSKHAVVVGSIRHIFLGYRIPDATPSLNCKAYRKRDGKWWNSGASHLNQAYRRGALLVSAWYP